MELTVRNLQKKISIRPHTIRRTLRKVLESLGIAGAQLSVVLVGEGRMRTLNRRYLGHDYVTDVLTFNLSDHASHLAGRRPENKEILIGEIIICPAVAYRNARRNGVVPADEIMLYAVHGVLHLLGYDDRRPQDARRMQKKQEDLMGLLKI